MKKNLPGHKTVWRFINGLKVLLLLGLYATSLSAEINLGMPRAVRSRIDELDQKIRDSTQSPAGRFASLPTSAQLLFTSNFDTGVGSERYEIYTMDLNGANITRISYTSEHHFIVGLDNSHRYLVDSRIGVDTNSNGKLDDGDNRVIWVVDLETKQETRLTDPVDNAESKSFSPDGQWIVFMKTKAGESYADIYKMRRDGTSVVQLTNTPAIGEGDPCWSNDGTAIAFLYFNVDRYVIKKMDVNGGSVATLTNGQPSVNIPGGYPPGDFDPRWSPDDQWIIFERPVQYTAADPENFGAGVWHCFKVRSDGSGFDGTGVVDLSQTGHPAQAEFFPSFSPDGQFIAFSANYENKSDLAQSYVSTFRMDINGGNLTRLLFNPRMGRMPFWIPQ